ncbi:MULTISPECIES: S1 domain-containing post-transcriptional regulator GSP13 [Psychrobacillus]|uniref:General stress protein 13 n=1 Tax=Psychrobacillus faecigallinarum TaxID=2762235 RepID=A0ABR8RD91_9BACI|nr:MULTISPECIES: S1 domain-containing post-transcriptional regulator GSP13 [Psychrobacillus]MBD7945700.1 general stress protein 13 [Psychrobacillus faecigallinarum]QEY22570.1 general stress protein 13 [Psychrobacillus sp. AK 1817]QGM29438.1 general stress protein 13 [Bacillus sp. N3536]
MTKTFKVGDVVTGKVTGIQPYGAFVSLDEQTQGLVHISEITYGYVKEVGEFLTVGQEVEVKILEIDEEASKISLSIRELQEKPTSSKRDDKPRKSLQARVDEHDEEGFNTLKEKLAGWIKQSIQ